MTRRIAVLLTLLAVAAAPTEARAQDFIVTVPIQATKLPAYVTTYTIICNIGIVNQAQGTDMGIGAGVLSDQPIAPGGTLVTEVRVPVTVRAGTDRAQANTYACSMSFAGTDPVTKAPRMFFRSDPNAPRGAQIPTFPTASGAPLTLKVTGTFQP